MRRWTLISVAAVALAAGGCASTGVGNGAGTGGGGGTAGSGGTGGDAGASVNDQPVHECSDAQVVVETYLPHDLATDSTHYYWFSYGDAGIAMLKQPKGGGDSTVVTEFPSYFSFIDGATDLPVSGDSQFYMDDTMADDADDYVYFSGDTQFWRVKKDGSEPVEAVSGPGLNERGPATCNFARSVLTKDAVFACRQGRIFRMNRAGDGSATAVYSAAEGGTIDAFALSGNQLFVNGRFDEARHLSPILTLPATGGTATEYGAMLEGLSPDALMVIDGTLVFDSLFVAPTDDLATASEWAKRQGTYKLTGASATPRKISESNLVLVTGVGQDSEYAYAQIRDERILRISLDGVTTTFVDCRDSEEDLRFHELLVDDDGVYIRDDESFYRFGK